MAEKKPTNKEQHLLDALNADISGAKEIQDNLTTDRQEYYKRFRGADYGNEREGWSKSISPVIWNYHQAVLPSFMEIFSEDFFTLYSDNEDRAERFRKLLKYQLFRKQDGFRKFYDFFFNCLLYEYAVFKVYYREDFTLDTDTFDSLSSDQVTQLAMDPSVQITKYEEVDDGMGGMAYEKVKVVRRNVTFQGPCLEVVPPWEFFFSKDCMIGDYGDIKGRLVFHRVRRTLDDIRKREKAGLYKSGSYEAVKEKLSLAIDDEEREYRFTQDSISEPGEGAGNQNLLAQTVEVDECYYMWDIDGDGLLEPCIIHKCDNVILQMEENPYGRPLFRVGSAHPEPHKVTGVPVPSILEKDQRVMTNLLRLIQDAAAQSCYRNPVTNDPQMFMQLIDRKPFAVIKGDPQRLGEVAMHDPSQFILKAYELLKSENEEKTGSTRYNQGMDADSLNKTATGITMISEASMKRLRMTARLLGNGAFTGVLRDFIFINQKWPSEDPVKLLGQNIQINQGDLDGEYDIEIDIGVGPGEKNAVAQQLDLLIQFATQVGVQMGIMTPIHVLRAQKKKYKIMNIKVDDLFMTEEEVKQKQMQMMQQQQAMMQQQQGPPGQGPPQGRPPGPMGAP